MKTGDNETLSAAIELGFLNDSQLVQIREQSEESNFPGLEIAIRKGFLDRRQLKILEAFRSPLDVAPGYRIDGLIGSGGAGVVYMATQLGLDRPVALKTISSLASRNELAPQRFEREAKIIGQLRHPCIVSAVDFGVHESQLYLVMEFADGVDAEKYQEKHGKLPELSAWYVAKQVCNALAYANELGVIHRDIKPGNLIFTTPPKGAPVPENVPFTKIADFGLARFKEPSAANNITIEAAISGTPFYMSPEQIGAMEVDHRSDIYSLGSTLWHLILGSPPITAASPMDILTKKMKLEDTWLDDCPKGMSQEGFELLREMCRFNEDERISDYAELNTKIEAVIKSLTAAESAANTTDLPGPGEVTGNFEVSSNVTFFEKMDGYDPASGFASTINLEQRDEKRDGKAASKSERRTASDVPAGRSSWLKWLPVAASACALALALVAGLYLFPSGGRAPDIAHLEYFKNQELTGPQIFLFDGLSVKGNQKFSGTWEVAEGLETAPVLSGIGTRDFKCVDDDRVNLEFFRFDCGFLHNESEQIVFRFLDDTQNTVFHIAITQSTVTLFNGDYEPQEIELKKSSGYNHIHIESQPKHWRVMVDAKLLGGVLKEGPPAPSYVIRVEVEGDGPAHFEQIRFRRFMAKEAVEQ